MKNFEPYYAVIFTSTRTNRDNNYAAMAKTMEDLAKQQPGFLGVESARNDIGITVSYWKTLDDIGAWKQQTNHILAQKLGKTNWYEWYKVRICKVEREYEFFK
ncbi:JEMB protein [Tamlana sedimentorum]|uniref:JEMB protein n=1 Tax=Neotamlana sedimentorum TaxID=1435349 RepID=A0A0D7WBR9_9FLAO|nr:antibiotic biosynthesis monooxygenase [Tamlana sedimentorum]KJD36625.1 JEMB protein [Tamlana sedimentorum]